MKQLICKNTYYALYGTATGHNGFGGNATIPWEYSGNQSARHPWSVTGSFKNLRVVLPVAQASNLTVTFVVNGVDTALAVTILAGQTVGANTAAVIGVTKGIDDVCMKLAGTQGPGFDLGYSIEFEGDTVKESSYALSAGPHSGTIGVGVGYYGGTFGNGVLAQFLATFDSNTYSIATANGAITRLDAKAWSGAPGGGAWDVYIVKNRIIQDGAGGTVNTKCTISGASDSASSTFNLPISIADRIDTLVVRRNTEAVWAVAHVAISCAFTATTDGEFHLCGGDNDAPLATSTIYKWNDSEQQKASEAGARAPVGPTGFTAKGLYVRRDTLAPGGGKSWTHNLRKGGVTTALVVVISDAEVEDSLVTDVAFEGNSDIVIQVVPAGTPAGSQLHWGLRGFITPPVGPPPEPPHSCECCVATKVSVINQALMKIGVSQTIVTPTEQTREAYTGNFFYEMCLRETLRQHPWSFATKYARKVDAVLSTDPMYLVGGSASVRYNRDWQYAYRYPSDCVFARRIVNPATARKFDAAPIPFRVGRVFTGVVDNDYLLIFSDQPDAELEYTAYVECSANFGDTLFENAVSWNLGAKIAPSLSRLEKVAEKCWQMYLYTLTTAAAVSSREQQHEPHGEAEWIRARGMGDDRYRA